MRVAIFLRQSLSLLVPLAIASTVYLYLFPIFSGCAFPVPSRDSAEAFSVTKHFHWPYASSNTDSATLPTKLAPFRLLALGDPQLEGDTSIPISYLGVFPHVKSIFLHATFQTWHWTFRDRIRQIVHDVVDIFFEDIPFLIESGRKVFDLFGNDFYLAHIYRTVHWWTKPTHVTVLGDLLGSQWIEDEEFERRGRRFWERSFAGGERVPDEVTAFPEKVYNVTGNLTGSVLGAEEEAWTRRIINVAGNHDIGYAGDLTEERMERFERVFGKASYELRFELPVTDPLVATTLYDEANNPDSNRVTPELRLLVINDMNLDTPAKSPELQDATYAFINAAINTAHAVEYEGHFTMILTHIPMYKPEGVCVDAPFFDFHYAEDGGGVKEQYLLSADASKGFLEGIFGMNGDTMVSGNGRGRKGMVLNGHDHEGCDTFHFINQTNGTFPHERSWEQKRWAEAQDLGLVDRPGHPGRREITVRSMMGDFGGNAGLLSMWFDEETWEWQHEYVVCPLGRPYFWWFTHFLDIGVVLVLLLASVVRRLESSGVKVDAALDRAFQRVKSAVVTVVDTRVQVKLYRASQSRTQDQELRTTPRRRHRPRSR